MISPRNGPLDCLLVLGGENSKTKPRTNKTIEILRVEPEIPTILSGSHSGVYGKDLPLGKVRECDQMFNDINRNVSLDCHFRKEGKSLCTLGNLVFSSAELPPKAKSIGILTDPYHMKRALWLAEKVIPELTIVPIYASQDTGTYSRRITENLLLEASQADLRNIKSGDLGALYGYLFSRNPMYNPEAGFSWFGLCVKMARIGMKAKPL